MVLQGLSNQEHSKLLYKLHQLPFGDRQALVYRKSMEELYSKYNDQLDELMDTIAAYKDVAVLIAQKQPVVNQRKYVRVRQRQTVLQP